MNATSFIATTGNGLSRAYRDNGNDWHTESILEGTKINCLVHNYTNTAVIYVGTQGQGILRSDDYGKTWQSIGLAGQIVKSIAVYPQDPNIIYAGTKPPAIFVTQDGGEQWTELLTFRDLRRWFWFTPAEDGDPYVMGLAVSPIDSNHVIAGVEFGGMFRSTDGGQNWQGHLSETSRDCHNLKFHHTDGRWVYQAGGGWPAAVSANGGVKWSQPRRGLGWSFYGMACASDPLNPEIWYLSAAPHAIFPDLHKMPRGHWNGEANAFIFRKRGSEKWQRLGGGLPQLLNHMAYALVTDSQESGHLYAGLSNGDIWFSADYGDTWRQLELNLRAIKFSLVMLSNNQ